MPFQPVGSLSLGFLKHPTGRNHENYRGGLTFHWIILVVYMNDGILISCFMNKNPHIKWVVCHCHPLYKYPNQQPRGPFWPTGFHQGKLKVASELSLITCWMVADTRLMQLPPGPTNHTENLGKKRFLFVGPQEKRGMKPSYSNWEGMKFDAQIYANFEFPL